MGVGIIVCGLNGSGKSTLGRALAEKLDCRFIDSEDLYFPSADTRYSYASPRTHEEVKAFLLSEIKARDNFVFASVKGDYGEEVYPFFRYAVFIDVEKAVRMERVRKRSFQKFGARMLPGGDLYEQEKGFFDFVESRDVRTVEDWLKRLSCPVIRVDGARPIAENINYIAERVQL